jgi:hypothetical protein
MGAKLKARLRRLEDQQAILEMLTRYAWAIDYGPDEEWPELFTKKASIDIRYRQGASLARVAAGTMHDTGVRHEGREQLAAFKLGHTRAPASWHKHVVANVVIEVDGKAATARSYLVRVDEVGGTMFVRTLGQYRDRLRRGADGQWRFVERIIHIEAINRPASPEAAS